MSKLHTICHLILPRLAKGLAFVCVLIISACGGRYQAPMSDQSSTLDRTPPPIYSTSGSSGTNGVVNSSAPSTRATTAAVTTGASSVNAGVRVQPAPGVSITPVEPGASIGRSGISRAPIQGASTVPSQTNNSSIQSTPNATTNTVPATHIVARGETLYSIAWQYSLDHRALAVANQLPAPYTIYPNQELRLNIASVSNSALQNAPSIPAAPAGASAANTGTRPAEAVAQRRTGSVATKQVEGISWQWPVDGRVLRGYSASNTATSRGIDIGAAKGAAVYAAADGDVVYSGSGIQGQGDLIIIRHSARHLSAYSHNSAMLVKEGAAIRAGDKIGEVGSDANGSELIHFEVRVDGAPVDPARYLPSR